MTRKLFAEFLLALATTVLLYALGTWAGMPLPLLAIAIGIGAHIVPRAILSFACRDRLHAAPRAGKNQAEGADA